MIRKLFDSSKWPKADLSNALFIMATKESETGNEVEV